VSSDQRHAGDEGVAVASPPEPPATSEPNAKAAAREATRRRIRKEKPAIRKAERWLSRLSAKFPFVQRLSSLLFLPYAFRSGIRMKRLDASTFTAVLPFKRFNRNWYNAMAGGALLANSEIAAGMYLFGACGGGYSIVCKRLNYEFLRPCFGPAVYRVRPKDDLDALLATNEEFNVTLEMDILQQISGRKGRDRRVGRCECVFYATPKSLRKVNRDKTRKRPAKPSGQTKPSGDEAGERAR
jgi:acyl-coenzyme A thioesterase PaaI-like protein